MNVVLWDVYATIRQPEGSVWDGASGSTIDFGCYLSAAALQYALRTWLESYGIMTGTSLDSMLMGEFRRYVAEQCGLASNWFETRYEGPDMFAEGAYSGDAAWRWRTYAVQDSWEARLNVTNTGRPAMWSAPCGSTTDTAALNVTDEDLVFNDPVGQLAFTLGDIPPEVLCGGWGWLDGIDGIAGVLVRVNVSAPDQNCAGIVGTRFQDYVLRPQPVPTVPQIGLRQPPVRR